MNMESMIFTAHKIDAAAVENEIPISVISPAACRHKTISNYSMPCKFGCGDIPLDVRNTVKIGIMLAPLILSQHRQQWPWVSGGHG
jgi:hypothetical protein